ncbi:MAG TPA: CU044_2847 family protein [Thermoleophilaceae bacterium]|jgi:hypothetical protein
MNGDTVVDAALPGGGVVQVRVAEGASGIGSVGRNELELEEALEPIGEVAAIVRDKLAALGATKATAAFGVSLTVKTGKLSALIFESQGAASLTVTLEWVNPAPA